MSDKRLFQAFVVCRLDSEEFIDGNVLVSPFVEFVHMVAPVFGEQCVFKIIAIRVEGLETRPVLVPSDLAGDIFAIVLREAQNGFVLSALGARRVDDPSAPILQSDTEEGMAIFTNRITPNPRAVVVHLHFRGEDADMDLLDFGRVAWVCTILAGSHCCHSEFSVPLRSSFPSLNIRPDKASAPERYESTARFTLGSAGSSTERGRTLLNGVPRGW